MNRSTQRILITDLVSPPWPPDLLAVILAKEHGGSFDAGWSGSREHLAPL